MDAGPSSGSGCHPGWALVPVSCSPGPGGTGLFSPPTALSLRARMRLGLGSLLPPLQGLREHKLASGSLSLVAV